MEKSIKYGKISKVKHFSPGRTTHWILNIKTEDNKIYKVVVGYVFKWIGPSFKIGDKVVLVLLGKTGYVEIGKDKYPIVTDEWEWISK